MADDDKVSPAAAATATSDLKTTDSAGFNGSDPSKTHATIIEHAKAAADKEHSMTLMQGIRLYPKAIFWSFLISTCIVMEGFDVSLVNNFCAFRHSNLPIAVGLLTPDN